MPLNWSGSNKLTLNNQPMREVYIVEQSSGSYDDYRSWPVGAFPTKEAAEEWVAVNQPLFLADLQRQKEEAEEYQTKCEVLSDLYPYQWSKEGSPEQTAYLTAQEVFHTSWGDKATCEPYEEWGYSLNTNPIPYYGPDNL